jgi:hypothetical protein
MTRRLQARSFSAIVIALFLVGCGFERRGLVPPSPATAGGDGVIGGGGSSGTPMRTPPPATTTVEPATPPAADAAPPPAPPPPAPPGPTPPGPTTPSPDTGVPSTPPPVARDAGPATPPDTAPPPVNECADSSLKLPVQFTVRRAQPAGDLAFDGDGFLVSFDGRDLTRLARGGMPEMLALRPGRPNSTIDGLEWLPNGSVALADRQNDVVMLLDPHAPPQRRPDEVQVPQPVKILQAPNHSLYVTSAGGDLFLADPISGHAQSILRTGGHLRGLVYSVDFKSLYISDSSNRSLISVHIRPDSTVDAPTVVTRGLGSFADGIAIDACGNVYVSDNNGGALVRVTPTGKLETVSPLDGNEVAGLAFGSGKQGWDDHTLYAVGDRSGNFYEIKVGIRGAPPLP